MKTHFILINYSPYLIEMFLTPLTVEFKINNIGVAADILKVFLQIIVPC